MSDDSSSSTKTVVGDKRHLDVVSEDEDTLAKGDMVENSWEDFQAWYGDLVEYQLEYPSCFAKLKSLCVPLIKEYRKLRAKSP